MSSTPRTEAGKRLRDECIETDWPRLHGYGLNYVPGKGNRWAHRWAWEQAHGPIPIGMHVMHACDNRACINLDHLSLGTNAENVADKVAKGRQARGPQMRQPKPGEQNGRAKLTAEQVEAIRLRVANGETRTAVAREVGVHLSTVGRIAAGQRWTR